MPECNVIVPLGKLEREGGFKCGLRAVGTCRPLYEHVCQEHYILTLACGFNPQPIDAKRFDRVAP